MIWTAIRHPSTMPVIVPILRRTVREYRHPSAATRETEFDAATAEGKDGMSVTRKLYQSVTKTIGDYSMLEHLAAAVDREIVRPQYLAAERWVHLTLPPLGVVRRAGTKNTFDVSALVHESGVVIVTFAELDDGTDLSVGQLNARTFGGFEDFVSTTIDDRIVALAAEATGRTPVEGTPRGGEGRPATIFDTTETPVGLDPIYHLYWDALQQAVFGKKRVAGAEEYLHFAVVSLRNVPDAEHANVGGAIASRFVSESDDIVELARDECRMNRLAPRLPSLFLSEGAAVHAFPTAMQVAKAMRYKGQDIPGQDWVFDEMKLARAVDVFLLRLFILRTVICNIENVAAHNDVIGNWRFVLRNYQELAQERIISYGDLEDVETYLLETHDYARRLALVMQQIEIADRLQTALDRRTEMRRAGRLQVAILAFSVVIGIVAPIVAAVQIKPIGNHMPAIGSHPFSEWGSWLAAALPILVLGALVVYGVVGLAVRISSRLRKRRGLVALPEPKVEDGFWWGSPVTIQSPRWAKDDDPPDQPTVS